MNTLTYHDDWGDEQLADNGPIDREVRSDAEVLGRLCRMMDDDPLAFFVWTQRVMYRDRTYDQIAKRLSDMNPRTVTRQAIYDRIKKMLAREDGTMPARLVMPRALGKAKIKAKMSTFEEIKSKYNKGTKQ